MNLDKIFTSSQSLFYLDAVWICALAQFGVDNFFFQNSPST